VALSLFAAGCASKSVSSERNWVPEPAADLGAMVARVGAVPIFAQEVKARAAESGLPVREALAEMVQLHVMAEKARLTAPLSGVTDRDVKSALVQRLLEREFEAKSRPEDVPEEELRARYQELIEQFVHPRLVEVVVLSIYTGERMKPEPRAERRATAQELAAYVEMMDVRTPEAFLAVARDPAWAKRRVSVNRLWQGVAKPFGPEVGAAVARLKAPGDTTPMIEDESGFHVARYIKERPPENTSFADAREKLRNAYHQRWRALRFLEFTSRLREAHNIEVYTRRLTSAGQIQGS
jgi:hypothetical protein